MEPLPPYFSRAKPPCRLSDPAQPHMLCRRRRPSHPPLSICFSCKGKQLKRNNYYYYCATCNLEFHRGCHIFLPEIRHPFHPSHPLTFISLLLPKFDVTKIPKNWMDSSSSSDESEDDDDDEKSIKEECEDDGDDDDGDSSDSDDDDNNFDANNDGASLSDGNHLKCKCCQVPLEKIYYHCSICKFNLNVECSMRPPPTTISHLKSHEHILTLFPIRLPLPCGACGLSLSDAEDLVYACLPCNLLVHRSCIYLPRVIKITRHPHRLSLTPSLQPGDFSCGVCRQTVDVNYGQYSCDKECHYAVHSKCATRNDVWDGKDLDGVPEEPDEFIEPPFLKIDEETIQHFSHHHHLKLHEKKTIGGKDKFCEACTLPVMISQRYYGCMQCDFVLDETCASLPRKKNHPLHKHPLNLHTLPLGESAMINKGERGMIDMGISRTATVLEAWTNRRRRRHRMDCLRSMEEMLVLKWNSRTQEQDRVLWKGKNDVFRPTFSTKDTWNHTRTTSNEVAWHKGVWFAQATPKHAFCMWLAVQNRLSTGDRMLQWNNGVNATCVLCNSDLETRDHIFFSCGYAKEIWEPLAKNVYKSSYSTDWNSIITCVSKQWRNRVAGLLARYVLQASIHTIWRERNERKHGTRPNPSSRLIKWIDIHIRNQLSALKISGDQRYNNGLQLWFASRRIH